MPIRTFHIACPALYAAYPTESVVTPKITSSDQFHPVSLPTRDKQVLNSVPSSKRNGVPPFMMKIFQCNLVLLLPIVQGLHLRMAHGILRRMGIKKRHLSTD